MLFWALGFLREREEGGPHESCNIVCNHSINPLFHPLPSCQLSMFE
jgi:hypothetical protein